jgi:hypothetical protein
LVTDDFACSLLPDCSEGASSAVAFAVPFGAEGVLLVVVPDHTLSLAEDIASVTGCADSSLVAPSLTQVTHLSASSLDIDSSEYTCVAVVVVVVVETVVVLSRCYVSVGIILVIIVVIIVVIVIVVFFLIIVVFDFFVIFVVVFFVIIIVAIVFLLIVLSFDISVFLLFLFFDFVLECCSDK